VLKQTLNDFPDLAERILAKLEVDPLLKAACEDYESIARKIPAVARQPHETEQLKEILGEIENEILRRLEENSDN